MLDIVIDNSQFRQDTSNTERLSPAQVQAQSIHDLNLMYMSANMAILKSPEGVRQANRK